MAKKTRTKKSKRSSTRKRPKKRMAKRRSTKRRSTISSGFRRTKSGIGGFLKSGPVGQIVKGIGAGAVATLVLNRIAPQFTPIGSVAAGFLGGGIIGGAANLFLSGGLGNLGGLLGGNGVGNGQGDAI